MPNSVMKQISEHAETAVAESPISFFENIWVRRVSAPYPHTAPIPRSMTRAAEFLKRLS
jgi:hypothetical protein